MKTNLPRHHHDVVEQMLDAVYDATDEHDLLLQLETVAHYVAKAIKHKHGSTYCVFDGHGARKIEVIRFLRAEFIGLGLKEAKTLAESGPWLIGCHDTSRAALVANSLRRLGASISTRNEAQMAGVDRASKGTIHE